MADTQSDVVAAGQEPAAAAPAGAGSGQRRQRRQQRVAGGRQRPVHVRVSDEEYVQLAARAAAAGLSLPAWLVAAGMADRGGRTGDRDGSEQGGRSLGGGSMSVLERRAWAAEFVAVRRLARGVATNVNQLAAGYNATGTVAPELHAVLDAARRVMDRMDDLGARLAGVEAAPADPVVVDEDLVEGSGNGPTGGGPA